MAKIHELQDALLEGKGICRVNWHNHFVPGISVVQYLKYVGELLSGIYTHAGNGKILYPYCFTYKDIFEF